MPSLRRVPTARTPDGTPTPARQYAVPPASPPKLPALAGVTTSSPDGPSGRHPPCPADRPPVSSHYRRMYRVDTLRRCNESPVSIEQHFGRRDVHGPSRPTSWSWPSSVCCTRRPCTATSCASGSTRCSGAFRALSYGTLYPCLKTLLAAADPRGATTASTARRRWPAAGRGSSTSSPPRARSASRRSSPSRPGGLGGRALRRPLRLLRPHRRRAPGCASWRAAAAGSEERLEGVRQSLPRTRGAARPATPSSCSGTAWSRSSARCAGSPS